MLILGLLVRLAVSLEIARYVTVKTANVVPHISYITQVLQGRFDSPCAFLSCCFLLSLFLINLIRSS